MEQEHRLTAAVVFHMNRNAVDLQHENEIPLHLRDRAPFTLPNTEILIRYSEADVIGEGGHVRMAGAIEFQTQITPGRLADVCDPEEIYKPEMRLTHRFRCVYDPEIQRGVKEPGGPKEFLRPSQIEAMTQDIMENRFECPQLMWNLRAGDTTWVYLRDTKQLRIYEGVASRPDTNHRHHAIIQIQRRYLTWVRDTGSTRMGDYNPHRGYGLVIYTDDFQGEAHRFYVYNFMGWRVPTSTAHFIESKTHSPQLHTKLAREVMEGSGLLGARNVELLSNQLSSNSAKMITFGTLVDAIKGGFPALMEDKYDETKEFLLKLLEELNRLRPQEIALISISQRQRVRTTTVADQAVVWHAYIRAAARLREIKPHNWQQALDGLAGTVVLAGNTIDVLSRQNPAWAEKGVIAPGKKGPRVVNNRQAREGAYEYICQLLGVSKVKGTPEPDQAAIQAARISI
jgi:hypothetical protein